MFGEPCGVTRAVAAQRAAYRLMARVAPGSRGEAKFWDWVQEQGV